MGAGASHQLRLWICTTCGLKLGPRPLLEVMIRSPGFLMPLGSLSGQLVVRSASVAPTSPGRPSPGTRASSLDMPSTYGEPSTIVSLPMTCFEDEASCRSPAVPSVQKRWRRSITSFGAVNTPSVSGAWPTADLPSASLTVALYMALSTICFAPRWRWTGVTMPACSLH